MIYFFLFLSLTIHKTARNQLKLQMTRPLKKALSVRGGKASDERGVEGRVREEERWRGGQEMELEVNLSSKGLVHKWRHQLGLGGGGGGGGY